MARSIAEIASFISPVKTKGRAKCFCPIMRHLPEAVNVTVGYCECSRGYLEQTWSAILGQTAEVEVIETCLTGAQECVFRIRPRKQKPTKLGDAGSH